MFLEIKQIAEKAFAALLFAVIAIIIVVMPATRLITQGRLPTGFGAIARLGLIDRGRLTRGGGWGAGGTLDDLVQLAPIQPDGQ